jgi:SAM-dependent methyltransferase
VGAWEPTVCADCGSRVSERLFAVAHSDAPDGECAIVQCSSCGLRRLDPRPTPAALSDLYADDYYAYVGRRRSLRKQRLWEILRDSANGAAPARSLAGVGGLLSRPLASWLFDINVDLRGSQRPRVIDVGCGYGDLLIYLKSRGCDVVGVDVSERAAAIGAEHDVPIHVGELNEFAFPDGAFDVAILQHSLEHVPDPRALITEIARIVRPGGTLHVAVPNGAAAGLYAEREAWGCLVNPEHFWYFDLASLERVLESAGFVTDHVRYRTVWRNHVRLWREEAASSGAAAASLRVTRFIRARVARHGSADILRLVARRLPERDALPNAIG